MASELADVAVCRGGAYVVNIKYLKENSMLPYIQTDAEAEVPVNASMRRLLETGEHSGCSSGRCRAIILICEDQSSDCLTNRPRSLGADETPNPRPPQALRTDFPPKREKLEGFLGPDQGDRVTTHLRECIQYLTESYTSGGHARPFQAAKQHLMDILTAETAPQEPSAAEDAAIEEATDQDHADNAPENPAPGAELTAHGEENELIGGVVRSA